MEQPRRVTIFIGPFLQMRKAAAQRSGQNNLGACLHSNMDLIPHWDFSTLKLEWVMLLITEPVPTLSSSHRLTHFSFMSTL